MRTLSMRGAAIGLTLVLTAAMTMRSATGAVLSEQDEALLALQDAGGSSPTSAEGRAFERARRELNQAHYAEAAKLFEAFAKDFAASPRRPDSRYWQAYSLYQLGQNDQQMKELAAARDILEAFGRDFPTHELHDESLALLDRVRATLAESGSLKDREEILREIDESKGTNKSKSKSGDGCDDEIRMTAVVALQQMDADRAMPILEKVLANKDECPELREKALFVVAQNEGPQSLRVLVDAAHKDPDIGVREKAVFWLSQMPGDAALDAIVQFLNDAKEPRLQEQAVFALSQHSGPRAAAVLRDVAGNAHYTPELREKAIFWLSQSDADDSFPFLTKLYTDLDDPDLREKVIFAISQSDSREAGAWLRARAMDPKEGPAARKRALFWLSNNGDLSCEDMLKLYTTFTEPEMREQVLFGLSQLDDACAVDALIQIVQTEKDEELAEKALFWLGQTDDERAYRFIEELIDKGRGGKR